MAESIDPNEAIRAAAEAVGEYLQAPPSMWDTIERLIAKHTRAAIAGPRGDALTAYNQAIEDAKAAIRAETTDADGSHFFAATYINAIARKCSPHVYVNRLDAATSSLAPAERVNAVSHWRFRAGVEETMCGLEVKGLLATTLLSDAATCEKCKAAAFGYQMGRADERAATAPAERTRESIGHHKPNWLWCERCQAWIETAHQCGAHYIDKGSHFELLKPAAPVPIPVERTEVEGEQTRIRGWILGSQYQARGYHEKGSKGDEGEPWYVTDDGTHWSAFDVQFFPDHEFHGVPHPNDPKLLLCDFVFHNRRCDRTKQRHDELDATLNPVTGSDSARRAAEEIADWMNWKKNIPQIAHEQNIVSLTNMLSKYFVAAAPADNDTERLRWLLKRIIADLPKNRDWLDPDVEQEARELAKGDYE